MMENIDIESYVDGNNIYCRKLNWNINSGIWELEKPTLTHFCPVLHFIWIDCFQLVSIWKATLVRNGSSNVLVIKWKQNLADVIL